MTQRTTPQTREWFRANQVWPGSIGFDPDGMCQKIARTARNIGPGYASALAQQVATPRELRVYDVEKAQLGMVGFFDDPHDSNPFGHIATLVARVKGVDRGSLESCLFRTNAVVQNHIVLVRGTYFKEHWGDDFQFFGKTINGVELDLPEQKTAPAPPTLPARGIRRLEHMLDVYDEMIAAHEGEARIVHALRRDKREIRETIKSLRAA